MQNERDTTLHEALINRDAHAFQAIPHTDLHCHSITSVPLGDFRELSPDIEDPPSRFTSFSHFSSYLREQIVPVVTNLDTVRLLTRASFSRLVDEGVRYVEMSFDLTVPECVGATLEEYFAMIEEERAKISDRVRVCVEAGLDREIDPDRIFHLFKQAADIGVIGGVDLYGDEGANPAEKFRETYALARKLGIKRKAHTGELGTAQDMSRAIEALDLQAIQHGIAAAGSREVINLLLERNITLNLAPQSNLSLGLIDNIRDHPIAHLLHEGVSVTVNSDDYTIFGKSVAEQLIDLHTCRVCSESDIAQIIDNGLLQSSCQ